MGVMETRDLARVTYRATLADGQEAEFTMTMPGEAATVADAWRRMTETFGEVDPLTLEIEVRRRK